MKRLAAYLLLCAFALTSYSQPSEYKMTRKEYIQKFRDIAVKEMMAFGIPASVTLAQGILESSCGNSALAVYANNHFGIKCHKEWDGMTYVQDDDENDECFRKYSTPVESFNDHSKFLNTRPRYAFLFELKPTDYKGWAYGLKEAGYATDPKYADQLIQVIEENKLFDLDRADVIPVVVKTPPVNSFPEFRPQKFSYERKILLNNNVKYVVAREGDTYFKIANELSVDLWQLYKYNEVGTTSELAAGDIVYLHHKKRSAQVELHTVKKGETMYAISQQYGIKLKLLYRKNNMKAGEEPKKGDSIWLKGKKK